ncbi:MAG: pyridoxamine 5'-phosphate oxidase [Bacteroidia bacterium]
MEDVNLYIKTVRHDFTKQQLTESDVNTSPFLQFEKWFKEAVEAKVNEPNAMGLSTVSLAAKPSSRIVFLRSFNNNSFAFYTNYNSKKGKEINENPHAALLFFWPELERQIRIEGTLHKQTTVASDDYFNSRPYESKLGAWTSEQSSVIKNRESLESEYVKNEKKFTPNNISRPPHWGGYELIPTYFEFWQGRPNRLHDRILYSLENDNWKIVRLAP